MESEVPEGGSDKALNRMVAITVVILSVFLGLSNIKDGNIVQAMQQAQADSVDRWSEYQATRLKLHVVETARAEVALSNSTGTAQALQKLDASIAKYTAEAPKVRKEAQGFEDQYNGLNVHDDQFDMSEAMISIALSLAAVAALTELRWLLYVAWAPAAFGLLMGIAGFAGWSLHPDALASFLS